MVAALCKHTSTTRAPLLGTLSRRNPIRGPHSVTVIAPTKAICPIVLMDGSIAAMDMGIRKRHARLSAHLLDAMQG